MKDDQGLYYYPFPQNKRVRMYVRPGEDEIEFRLWNQDVPQLWAEHGWVPFSAIKQATTMYRGGAFDPNVAYDLAMARALIDEEF